MNRQYRFFYHYFKTKGKMSVHFKKKCMIVDNVCCEVPCETKWQIKQPRLIMQGFCSIIKIINNTAIIQ